MCTPNLYEGTRAVCVRELDEVIVRVDPAVRRATFTTWQSKPSRERKAREQGVYDPAPPSRTAATISALRSNWRSKCPGPT
jgi:hypothetical protein